MSDQENESGAQVPCISLLAFCRMCKVWDDVSKECLKDECPVEKLPVAAQRLLDAWDAKTPLAWQPENNRVLLEDLREALHPANAEGHGRRSRTVQPLVGGLNQEGNHV